MNFTKLTVIAGILLAGTVQAAEVSPSTAAGMCSAAHVIWAGVNNNTNRDLANRNMVVVEQLDARYKNNADYQNTVTAAIRTVTNTASSQGSRAAGQVIAQLSLAGCGAAGVPGIILK